ncbi:nuclear transport factor 2 family protein [Edaphovirga cremea]|uniref:nuclear transport factor 2 family protein n=1 Tax=Edaphovirga cremea TaxID=2267246 RepID=UPI000DEFE145|nr:nuclear transport factor 2 family protein [Edaphovirga cremea]
MSKRQKSLRINLICEYYQKLASQDVSLLHLFSEDVVIFFPKFGVSYGKPSLTDLGMKLSNELAHLYHDPTRFSLISEGDAIVVEGLMHGVMRSGERWPKEGEDGRYFCTVFEFKGNLIQRMHVYLDPDFDHKDVDRVKNYTQ